MMQSAKQFLRQRWDEFSQTPFGCLVLLFVGRMFHGSTGSDAGELDLSFGVVVILLAMPGVLVSLLMFEKYGSLIRFCAVPAPTIRSRPPSPMSIFFLSSPWSSAEPPHYGAGTASSSTAAIL